MHVFRFRHFVGQALLNVSYSGITFFALFCFSCKSRFSKIALIRTVFLNQLIQFYSNNATKLHHLTTHSTTVLPHKMAIVLRPQMCDVISPYVYGIRRIFRSDHVSKACSRRASLRDCPWPYYLYSRRTYSHSANRAAHSHIIRTCTLRKTLQGNKAMSECGTFKPTLHLYLSSADQRHPPYYTPVQTQLHFDQLRYSKASWDISSFGPSVCRPAFSGAAFSAPPINDGVLWGHPIITRARRSNSPITWKKQTSLADRKTVVCYRRLVRLPLVLPLSVLSPRQQRDATALGCRGVGSESTLCKNEQVAKVIWQKAASPLHTGGSIIFAS